jgi:hypothetical protein
MSKTHVIDGVTYVEADRVAEVGEKVLIVNAEHTFGKYRNGDVLVVQRESTNGGIESDLVSSPNGNTDGYIGREEYVVLEPLQSEESPDVTDLLANLARRVSSLEQQLRDTQGNTEKLAEELATVKHMTHENDREIYEVLTRLDNGRNPKEVESVTFEKFLDSVTDEVAKKLAGKVASDIRTELRIKALRGF